jgi:steroid delta-isomerase-like uncharacterized protein
LLGTAGLAAAGLALAPDLVAAQASPMATPAALPDPVRAWVAAWNSADPAGQVAALYTPDGVYEDVPSNTRSKGGDVQGYLTPFVKSVSDITVTPTDAFATAEWAALEYVFAATDQGYIPGGQGKRFSVRTATIFQLQGGKIARSSDYLDVQTILVQLGLVPGPATPAAVATPTG